jgi:hypothetical protein
MKREQAIEEAQAKGHRPCPVCGAMADLGSTANVFVSAAFEPSDDELLAEARRGQGGTNAGGGVRVKEDIKVERKLAQSLMDIDLTLSDSDDDMPDLSEIIAKDKAKRKVKGACALPALLGGLRLTGVIVDEKPVKDVGFNDVFSKGGVLMIPRRIAWTLPLARCRAR